MTADMPTLEVSDPGRVGRRRSAVMALYGFSAFWGVAQVVAPGDPFLDLFGKIAFATCAALWFVLDCRVRGRPALPILQHVFFFTWPVAALVHLLLTRGWRGIGYWLLHLVGLLVTMYAAFIVAMLLR